MKKKRPQPTQSPEEIQQAGLEAVRQGILTGDVRAPRPQPMGTAEIWGWARFEERVRAVHSVSAKSENPLGVEQVEDLTARNVARCILDELRRRTEQGDPAAAQALAEIAHHACDAVNKAASAGPEPLALIQAHTRKFASFPVLTGPHEQMQGAKYIRRRVDLLKIGEAAPANTSGSDIFRGDGTAYEVHRWTWRLCNFVANWRTRRVECGLAQVAPDGTVSIMQPAVWMTEAEALDFTPPAPLETAERAWEIAWKALLWATGEEPETIPELYQIGKFKLEAGSGRKGHADAKGAAKNAVQAGIMERLRQSWIALFCQK